MSEEKIIDKVQLSEPIAFWSEILVTLDKKVELIKSKYKFGKVNMSIVINKGVVYEVIFTDEVKTRRSVEIPYPSTKNATQLKGNY